MLVCRKTHLPLKVVPPTGLAACRDILFFENHIRSHRSLSHAINFSSRSRLSRLPFWSFQSPCEVRDFWKHQTCGLPQAIYCIEIQQKFVEKFGKQWPNGSWTIKTWVSSNRLSKQPASPSDQYPIDLLFGKYIMVRIQGNHPLLWPNNSG